MPFNLEDFLKNSHINLGKHQHIIGMDDFLNVLEFHYFSKVKLLHHSIKRQSLNLVLEIDCNLKLLELLSHFNIERWGHNTKPGTPLQQCLELLDLKNNLSVDIEELTLLLNDTSIVIKNIYPKSIVTEFNEILKSIASNYVFLTEGLTKKPYEIFIPIFEDTLDNLDFTPTAASPKTYSEFWGVYLDKDDEASIYDVQRSTYINGNLEFLTDYLLEG